MLFGNGICKGLSLHLHCLLSVDADTLIEYVFGMFKTKVLDMSQNDIFCGHIIYHFLA